MDNKKELVEQCNLAFDLIQKLYLEVSYLIKEIESNMNEEPERFIIGKPSGYGINTRNSTGLDSNLVKLWLLRKLGIFFVAEEQTKIDKGQTITRLNDKLKVIYLRFILNDDNIKEPTIYMGYFHNISGLSTKYKLEKFEKLMGHFEYNENKVFQNLDSINYEDAYIRLQGRFITQHLFDIDGGEAIQKKIVEPVLKMYRSEI